MATVSGTFTAVGVGTSINLARRGDGVAIAISGTYAQSIKLQREVVRGSGVWEDVPDVGPWTTANATVAANYYAKEDNETLRLNCYVDTSGTSTWSLTDDDRAIETKKDDEGLVIWSISQGQVRMSRAFTGGAATANVTTATATVAAASHAGRVTRLNRAAGITVTLPAATGSQDEYEFLVETTATGNHVIQVANATDVMTGVLSVTTDAAGVTIPTAATSDTITMSGSTTGGVKGSRVKLKDVASGLWAVSGALISTGAEATPFSAAV